MPSFCKGPNASLKYQVHWHSPQHHMEEDKHGGNWYDVWWNKTYVGWHVDKSFDMREAQHVEQGIRVQSHLTNSKDGALNDVIPSKLLVVKSSYLRIKTHNINWWHIKTKGMLVGGTWRHLDLKWIHVCTKVSTKSENKEWSLL